MDHAVFGYIRVSQAEGESGLDTQSRIFTDVASGRNMRRPAWTTLREKLQPGDVVVVPRLDRCAEPLGGAQDDQCIPLRSIDATTTKRILRTHRSPPASASDE